MPSARKPGNGDPYREVKERMNARALEQLPACREMVARAEDPDEMAARIAVLGNRLDSGARERMGDEGLGDVLGNVSGIPLVGDVAAFFRAADEAEEILYLADNAGEIVFDALLLERLPRKKVTVAVRGGPVLNDALRADARVAGIDRLVPVISNGSDIPGTVPGECGEEFLEKFGRADLIVSKGQGNFETLCGVRAPIWFLFSVKCGLVAAEAGARVGDLVVNKSSVWTARG